MSGNIPRTSPSNGVEECIIYGAGGFAREVQWLADRAWKDLRPVVFAEDLSQMRELKGRVVTSIEEAVRAFPSGSVLIAVGNPKTRRTLAGRVTALGGRTSKALIDPSVQGCFNSIAIGDGSIICAGSILTVDITIGRHVHINLDCTIGHDAILEDFVTLAPGVHVSGCVTIKEGSYIGTGASIINGYQDRPLVVGTGAVVGAQACVIRDVPDGATVVGVPAKSK